MGKARGGLRALRLFGGKKDEHVRIAAAKPRDQLAIAQNYLGVGRTGEDTRRGFRVFIGHGKVGPAQDRAVGVGGIGGG
jgi:hypothetical protein